MCYVCRILYQPCPHCLLRVQNRGHRNLLNEAVEILQEWWGELCHVTHAEMSFFR